LTSFCLFWVHSKGVLERINNDLTRPPTADQEDGYRSQRNGTGGPGSPLRSNFFGSCHPRGFITGFFFWQDACAKSNAG